MQRFEGRIAVVTGAASGIGRAIALRLARAGTHVVLADIEQEPLDAAVAEVAALGVDAIGVRTDVSDQASVDALAAAAVERFGRVHILVNNAGVSCKGYSWELSLADWKWVNDVCFWGVVHGIRSFVPGMVAHGEEGSVVNTSSMAGLGAAPLGAPYQTAKHGVVALTETLELEFQEAAPHLKATVLCPGYVATNIGNSARNRPDAAPAQGARSALRSVPQPSSAVRVAPDVIADLAFEAIAGRRTYAFADWHIWRPIVAERFAAILDRAADPVPVRLR